ncbi:MAG TPA: transglycosylase domain-containing protein [Patescibacteria group bacterium]|nr:transglycosylase domain-containing protein [Patescibacteria group bacterium]
MARRRHSTKKETGLAPFIRVILFCILSLIAIGNSLRTLVRLLLWTPMTMTNILARVVSETRTSIANWMHEKLTSRPKPRKRGRPKRVQRRAQPFLPWFDVRVKNLMVSCTKRVGQIQLPKLRVPRVTMPSVRLPSMHLPRISFPFITMPSLRIKLSAIRPPTLPRPLPSKRLPTEQSTWIQIKSFAIGVALTLAFIFVPYNAWLFLKSLPNPELLTQRDLEVSTKIMDRNGQLLYEIYVDQNRTPVKLEDIPLIVKQATLAIEDNGFYYHPGFSIRGILRAVSEIVVHKQIQGGSTITQQLIKSALLTPEVTIVRKTKEIILAFWAERLFSKDQIFEMYLNQVPYGGTAWGIETAAQTYFHKSVKELTLPEAALLAGLPAAPSIYSPFGSNPKKAYTRQKEVLYRMEEDGYITKEQREQAIAAPLQFATPRVGIRAPHFVMYVKEILEKTYGSRLVERGGLRVTTSLDLALEEKVETIVKAHIDKLRPLQVGNGAALVTNPRNGDILAMVGSRDYFDTTRDGNVNVTTALRQPGSSIKVVTYTTALENGMTAASIITDAPIVYKTAGSPPYAPVNYDGKFHGPTPLRYALANSYNIPAVKTLATVGLPAMMEKAKLMGIDSWSADPSRYGLSLTLGGGDVTMLEMANVYGTLANMGKREDLRPILEVTDYTGKVLKLMQPGQSTDAVKPDVAWIISHILGDNNARSSAFGPNSALLIPKHAVSVKTGTTNDKRDNWTIGYTPSYVAVVWVGNNDNSPMNPYLTSGITGAAPIWHDIMVELLKDKPDEVNPKPETVVSLPCYFGKVEYFVTGTEPPGGRCAPLPTITPTPTP